MFKLFDLKFREFPNINIKIGEGCPAACTDCQFNINYYSSVKQFSLDNILKRINEVDKKFDKLFSFAFGNCDGLTQDNIITILDAGLKTGREVIFQIGFNITKEHFLLFSKIEEKLGHKKISVKIAQNCRGISNISEKLVVLLKLLSINCKFNSYIDLFIDFNYNKELINFFRKIYGKNLGEHNSCFVIGKKIELKFHDYSWFYDKKNKCIVNLKREQCQHLDQLKIDKGYIYLKDSLDVYENGDLFLHDNLCNIGDIRISNLFFTNLVIYNHFNKYFDYLIKLRNDSKNQSEMCYKCISKGYKYKINKSTYE